MDCLMAQKLIKPFVEDQLEDRLLSDFLDHVETCEDCYDQLEVYYAIYHTLQNTDDDGDYNFKKKLDQTLALSRIRLRKRQIARSLRVSLILLAEGILFLVLFLKAAGESGLISYPHFYDETEREDLGSEMTETESMEEMLEHGAVTGVPDWLDSTEVPLDMIGDAVSGEVAGSEIRSPGLPAQEGEAGAGLSKEA